MDESETPAEVALHDQHSKLAMRQSVTSQITTVEDVEEICMLPSREKDLDAQLHLDASDHILMAASTSNSSSSSNDDMCVGDAVVATTILHHQLSSPSVSSSLSGSGAAVVTRDNIIVKP